MQSPEPAAPFPKVTRREFLEGSAALLASMAAAPAALGMAAAPPQDPAASSVPPLFLPPLLSRPAETSIRVTALNHQNPAEAILEWRKEGQNSWNQTHPALKVGPFEMLDWNLRDLVPSTRYEYRILAQSKPAAPHQPAASGAFRTQRKGPASYTALLITDPHTGTFAPNSEPALILDRVVKNASRADADFVLDLGDNVAWPGSREFPQRNTNGALAAYAQYRQQIGPLSRSCPHFAVIGNWSGESGKFPEKSIQTAASVRLSLLPGPNHLTYPQGGSEREDYYAFSWGGALYIILNVQTYSKPSDPKTLANLMSDVSLVTDWTLGEKQMAWFETTLRNATEPFRFVCIHHVVGGNAGDELNTLYGRGGARAWNVGEQARVHRLMKRHKVQIFFYGHDHVFVDDVVDGIHYALPGSCGAPWKFTKEETGYERFWPDSGHAQLDITPEKATVTYINVEGKILHSFSVLPS